MAPPDGGGADEDNSTENETGASSSVSSDAPNHTDVTWVATLKRLDSLLAKAEEYTLSLLLFILISVGVYQAVKRNFFPPAAWWPDEIIRYSTFGIGLLGAALATQSSRLISIDMLTRLFSPRGRLILRIITGIFTIVVCYLFAMASMLVRDSAGTTGEVMSPHTLAIVMPIAAALIALHISVRLVIDIHYVITNHVPPELATVAPKE